MDSNPIIKSDESKKYWNQIKEMQDTLNGLRMHAETSKGVNNLEVQEAYGKEIFAIKKIESKIKVYGT